MFGSIVQSAAVLTSAASAHPRSGVASLIPLILLVLVFVFTTRARAKRRGPRTPRAPRTGAGPQRRPRSARQAMTAAPAAWESDTAPDDESPQRSSDT